MNFSKEINGDVIIETVNITRATAQYSEEFRRILKEDIDNGWRSIVVDLSKCEFVDSTFLSSLVSALKVLSGVNGHLKVVSLSSEVQSLLELTGTSKVLEILPDKEAAIKSFSENKKRAV